MSTTRFSFTRPLAATFAAGLLAACGGDASPPATSSQAATAQQPQQQSTGAQGTSPNRISVAQCAQPSNGTVFFKVGDAVFGMPGQSVRDAIPASLQPPIRKEDVKNELQRQAAAGGGCPEKPIDARLLMVQTNLDHPLLDGTVGLLATPPEGLTAAFSRVTRQLQQNPTENCQPLGTDLIRCVGAERRGTVETPVMYVISTDTSQRMASGGPLAARCVLEDDAIRGCNMVDQLPGNVAFDVTLKSGNYTVAA
ncbi:MAG: hypothetical protein AAGB15_09345, partial [Pseudomonadota bacterium]